MDAKVKEKWLEALRSGKYAQATQNLRSTEGYCCLGVLCDIVRPDGWQDSKPLFYMDGHISWPPEPIALEVRLPLMEQEKLAKMNDDGRSFADIADYIEANL